MELGYWNARSVVNKVSSLFFILNSFEFDIFLVFETWLTDDILDCEISPPNYDVFRRDRPTRGGGVAIFVKSSLCGRVLPLLDGFECISVQLSTVKLVFSCNYIPPSPSLETLRSFFSYIDHLPSSYSHFICGDFNMPDINWDSLTSASNSLEHDSFCEVIFNNHLHQLIKEPTHIKGNILDLVLTDSPELIDNLCVHNCTYSSDHFLISASVMADSCSLFNFVPR